MTTPKPPGPDLCTREMHIRAVRKESREADFVCSTDTVDSYDSVIDQGSWRLDRFKRNPTVLWAHNSKELPVGQAKNTRVENGELVTTVWFSDTTQRAREVWAQVQEGTLRGISVGFDPGKVSFVTRGGVEDVMLLSDAELYEVSITSLPSNPDALARLRQRACDAGFEKPISLGLTRFAADSSARADSVPGTDMVPPPDYTSPEHRDARVFFSAFDRGESTRTPDEEIMAQLEGEQEAMQARATKERVALGWKQPVIADRSVPADEAAAMEFFGGLR